MKELKELLYGVSIEAVQGSTAVQVNEVTADSRNIKHQDLFIAVEGTAFDGHLFIEKAIEKGLSL